MTLSGLHLAKGTIAFMNEFGIKTFFRTWSGAMFGCQNVKICALILAAMNSSCKKRAHHLFDDAINNTGDALRALLEATGNVINRIIDYSRQLLE